MLTPEQTTFRRAQTDEADKLTLFFSVDSVDAIGRPVSSPWEAVSVTFTEEEATAIAAVVARARQAFCDRINGA